MLFLSAIDIFYNFDENNNLKIKDMKRFTLFICLLIACAMVNAQEKVNSTKAGGGTENFTNCSASSTYGDGTFVGNNSITWTYNHARDVDTFPINGAGLMFRRGSDSYLEANLTGGISSFEVKMKKAYTGARERKLELYINGNLISTSQGFGAFTGGDETVYTFSVPDINIPNDFTLKLKPSGTETNNQQIVIDDISWTGYASTEPYIAITSPSNGATVYSPDINIVFTHANFDLGTAGKVKYTVNGGDPQYTTSSPIALTGLADGNYAVVLELVDNSEASLSPQVTASVNFAINSAGPDITDIRDIQYTTDTSGNSPLINQSVTIRGVVTANFNGTTDYKGYYVQDAAEAWSGIYIFDETRTPTVGNTVTITGIVDEYFKCTQIKSVTYFEVSDITTEVYAPIEVTTANANQEQYESCFIKITNAECKSAFNQYGEWNANDNSGNLACKRADRNDGFTPTVGSIYNVQGVLDYSFSAFHLFYRNVNDVVIASINNEYAEQIKIYPNPVVDIINVALPEKANRITVLNNLGQAVTTIDQVNEANSINVEALSSGIYFIKIEKGTDTAVLKFVK
jgi:hypothetical protein